MGQRRQPHCPAIRNPHRHGAGSRLCGRVLLVHIPGRPTLASISSRGLPTRPEPLWITILRIALPLVPFIFSASLSRRSEESKDAGSGVASPLFACGLFFAIAAFFAGFLAFSPDPYAIENFVAIVVFVACSIWIIVSAFRIAAKASWGLFLLAGCATLAAVVVGDHSPRTAEHSLDRQYERQETQTRITSAQTNYDAHGVLALLAACLIEYRVAHRDAGFPSSLNTLPPGLRLPQGTLCNASIAAVPGYTFSYTPQPNASDSIVTDFVLVAMPQKKGSPRVDPMAVDSRGRIFSYIGWSVTDRTPEFVPLLVETRDDFELSQLLDLREEIRLFMQTNDGTPPAMLSKMSEHSDQSAYNETLTAPPYRLEYFPPTPDAPKAYMMAAVCQSYGDACIRSFLLDQNKIHQTSEPRQPTPQEPPIPGCEKYAQTCRDIDWPRPQ